MGSPPHTWRIQFDSKQDAIDCRITSTYVENTLIRSILNRILEDHLHIRGEYIRIWVITSRIRGSPPHTWRIHFFSVFLFKWDRITSTYVENTFLLKNLWAAYQDHLHIRGEYLAHSKEEAWKLGSPPHTWRILSRAKLEGKAFGITSTYVENTYRSLRHRSNC